MDLPDLLKVTGTGAIGCASAVAFLFIKGWVVPGWLYQAKCNECDKLDTRLQKSYEVTERAATVSEESLKMVQRVMEKHGGDGV